jgi:purine nucleosidase
MGQPGSDIDDGFALALALADPDLQVELVTTVNGNTDVDNATRLTLDLLKRLHRADVPVVRGAGRPLVRAWSRAGAGEVTSRPDDDGSFGGPSPHAAREIVERVMAEPGALTLVAVGPLTNIALALALEPRVASAVAEIVVMGGVYVEHTNVLAMPGEFNFWVDPHAADAVLTSGAPLRLVGLDVTRRVRLTRQHTARLTAAGGDFAPFAARCADEWITHLERTVPGDLRNHGTCALHDPLAVAAVAREDLVRWQSAHVRVEADSERTLGVAIADLLTTSDAPDPNCRIAVDVDADAFLALFVDRLAQFA